MVVSPLIVSVVSLISSSNRGREKKKTGNNPGHLLIHNLNLKWISINFIIRKFSKNLPICKIWHVNVEYMDKQLITIYLHNRHMFNQSTTGKHPSQSIFFSKFSIRLFFLSKKTMPPFRLNGGQSLNCIGILRLFWKVCARMCVSVIWEKRGRACCPYLWKQSWDAMVTFRFFFFSLPKTSQPKYFFLKIQHQIIFFKQKNHAPLQVKWWSVP
jgi:hypothetical protein